mgnify:CR=1 FL=1
MVKLLKSLLKYILGERIVNFIKRTFFEKKIPIHIQDIFGFDLYQNNNDIIDYSKFKGLTSETLTKNDPDIKIFKFMKRFLDDGMVGIDIGANIGLMSLFMSKLAGETGHVYAFEPGPVSKSLMQRNLFCNYDSAKNITLIDSAVSDIDGEVPLFLNGSGESDNQVHKDIGTYEFREEPDRQKVIVPSVKLDTFFKDFNDQEIQKIQFVKIDTQGHEWYVLNGAKEFFRATDKIVVLCEFAPYLKAWEVIDIEEFYNLLKSLGFDIYDGSNFGVGEIDLRYLNKNYGKEKISKYTDLLLVKGIKDLNFSEFL